MHHMLETSQQGWRRVWPPFPETGRATAWHLTFWPDERPTDTISAIPGGHSDPWPLNGPQRQSLVHLGVCIAGHTLKIELPLFPCTCSGYHQLQSPCQHRAHYRTPGEVSYNQSIGTCYFGDAS